MFSAQKPVILLPSPISSHNNKSGYGKPPYPPPVQPFFAFTPQFSPVNSSALPFSTGVVYSPNELFSSHISNHTSTHCSNAFSPKEHLPLSRRIDSGDLAIRSSATKHKKRKTVDIETTTLHGRPRSNTRNAIASAKFRERRKMRENALESRCEKLQESMRFLELQIQQLKQDLLLSNQEKQQWKDHVHTLQLQVQHCI